MIVRVLRARVRAGFEAEFMEQQRRAGVGADAIDGLLGYVGGRQQVEGGVLTISISFWRDIDAIHAFAGGTLERPILTPGQFATIEEWSLEHYEAYGEDQLFHGSALTGSGRVWLEQPASEE